MRRIGVLMLIAADDPEAQARPSLSRRMGFPGARQCSSTCARPRSSNPFRDSFPPRHTSTRVDALKPEKL